MSNKNPNSHYGASGICRYFEKAIKVIAEMYYYDIL